VLRPSAALFVSAEPGAFPTRRPRPPRGTVPGLINNTILDLKARVRAGPNSGKSPSDIFNIRSILDATGVEECDCTWKA